MTGKQLKNSILQWAIQGKLVPQDPNDEPASVLLEKIREEKARLIKEGKIKKDKKESIIYRGEDNSYYEKFADGQIVCIDEEVPFEIPQGWEWCRLGALITYQNGYAYTSSEMNKEKLGMPVIKSGNLMSLEVVLKPHNDYIEHPTQKMLASKIVYGDMLMCLSSQSDNPEPLGKTAIYKFDYPSLLNQRVLKFRPFFDSLTLYLYNVVNSFYFHYGVSHQGGGSAQANLKVEHVLGMLIPLAPQKEQCRIVNRIDELQPYISRFSVSKDNADSLNESLPIKLRKSILQEAIQGKLVPQDSTDEPASILLQRIKDEKLRLVKEGKLKKKDVVDSVIYKGDDNKYYEQVDGISLQIEADYIFPETWEVVRLAHICRLMDGEKKEGNYVCLDAKYLRGKSSGDILPNGKLVSIGDNIILVDGENSGEVFAVPHDGYMGSTFKQLWVSSNMYLPYVLYFIQFYKDLLRNSKKGAAIPHLNKEIFYSLVVGIPPYQEQERIAERIEEIMNKIKVA